MGCMITLRGLYCENRRRSNYIPIAPSVSTYEEQEISSHFNPEQIRYLPSPAMIAQLLNVTQSRIVMRQSSVFIVSG